MDLPQDIFRAYDIRGVAGSELTEEVAERIGVAFGSLARRHGLRRCVLGWDNRASSPALKDALARGMTRTGLDVIDVGLVATPVLYFARELHDPAACAMVTASHNPGEYNGFKLGLGRITLGGPELQDLRQLAQEGPFEQGSGSLSERDVRGEYIFQLHRRINVKKGLSVGVDCGNGTAGLYEPDISAGFGLNTEVLFAEPDASYPNHHPDPSVEANLSDLAALVRGGFDLGVAYDGDADRLGVVDDRGRFVYGDQLSALFLQGILPAHPGMTTLIDVKASMALIEEVRRLGGKPRFCPAGHSLVKAEMQRTGSLFGGELSGHFFFTDEYYGFDDPFYAAGRLYALLGDGKSLSEKLDQLMRTKASPEYRIELPDREKGAVIASLADAFREMGAELMTVDGVRASWPDGWILARQSNTQPAIAIRFEGAGDSEYAALRSRLLEAARALGRKEIVAAVS